MNKKFLVALPDSQGKLCWLAGYSSDPTRYYSKDFALRFVSRPSAKRGITLAKKTHPFKERKYIIVEEE